MASPIPLQSSPFANYPSLVSAWNFDGNSNDFKGANNGSDTAITYSATNAKFVQRAGFNGTTSVINIASPSGIPTGNNDRSIRLWVYPTASPSVFAGLTQFGNHGANDQAFEILINNALNIYVWLDGADDFQTTGTLSLNTWNLVWITYSAKSLKVYINSSTPETKTLANNLNTASTAWKFGQDSSSRFLTGNMDDSGIFSSVITPTEIGYDLNGSWPIGWVSPVEQPYLERTQMIAY